MKVRDLLSVWVWQDGAVKIFINTLHNPCGEDIRWEGDLTTISESGLLDCRVELFSVDFVKGVNELRIRVDVKTVPVQILGGWI